VGDKLLRDKLDIFWGSVITDFYVDYSKHYVKLKIIRYVGGNEFHHEIMFSNLFSFAWIDENNSVEWRYSELTSIHILEENDAEIRFDGERLNGLVSRPKILIEIWNSVLLIQAGKMIIDGEEFDLINS
jgi:hypothetical protein